MQNRLKLAVRHLSPPVVGLAALLLYAATGARTIVALYDDSLEFQLVGPTFGIAHPTGYPLYVLLSGIWSRLLFPFGNWAWRMNLFSAMAGAAAVALVFMLARRLAHNSNWAGLAAAVAFALGPVWWRQTTIAEVYALHGLFVAAILYTALAIGEGWPAAKIAGHHAGGDVDAQLRRMPLLLALIGLSLTHHRTSILLLPGVALYLLLTVSDLWRPRRAWLGWALVLLAPLLLYAYLPLRASMGVADLEGDYTNTWSGFWHHVLASGYTGFFSNNELAVERGPGDWGLLIRDQLGWVGTGLGGIGIGLGVLNGRRRPAWLLIFVTLVVHLLFAANYRVADAEVFAIPAFLCLAVGAGGAVGAVVRASESIAAWARLIPPTLVAILVLAPLGRGPGIDRSGDWAVHDYAVAMAKVDFPDNSQVVGLRGQMTALAYMQHAEGIGRAATPVAIDDPAKRLAYVESAVAAGTPLYLTQELAGIETRFSFSGEGPLVRVWPRNAAPQDRPTIPAESLLAQGALQFLGYDREVLAQAGGPALRMVFYWRPLQPLAHPLKLSMRMLDAGGAILAQEDRYPLRQVALTQTWPAGQIVRDVHDLPLPLQSQTLLVVVYNAETIEEVGRFEIPLP